ncbi:shikimate O-hydroxycinnamoyltransferase-like protein [Tanacetum coccineum]
MFALGDDACPEKFLVQLSADFKLSHGCSIQITIPNGSSSFFDSNVMKKSLADVLVPFYPMAGRMGRDESGKLVINCNNEGALFVEAESDTCLDDFGEFTPSPEFKLLTPNVDYSGDISSYPLFFAQARGLQLYQLTKLYVATDGRSRLSPHLPPGYLGNVVFTATPVDKSGNLTKGSLSNAAKLIHNTLTKMDNDYLRSAIDYLEVQPDMSALVRGPSYFASPNLNINAWTRLPVHDADFGYGRPIFMGPACILYEGTIYVLPSPNNDRSMSLAVCLDASEQSLFEKFLYEI